MKKQLQFTCLTLAVLIAGCVADESDPPRDLPDWKPTPASADGTETTNTDNETPVETIPMFKVKLETSEGDVVIEVHPDWAPIGAAHFKELVEAGYYDGCRFFRVVDGFMAQVGMNGDPKVLAKWRDQTLKDEPVKQSNTPGMVTYAKPGHRTHAQFSSSSTTETTRFSTDRVFHRLVKSSKGWMWSIHSPKNMANNPTRE